MSHNSDMSEGMYREHILELYRNPGNYGELKNPTHKHTENNAFCGDEITIHINAGNGKVKDAKFSGSGCVISMVSSSLLTDKIRGMKISDVKELGKKDMIKLLKINVNQGRIKCALLPLEAVKKCLK